MPAAATAPERAGESESRIPVGKRRAAGDIARETRELREVPQAERNERGQAELNERGRLGGAPVGRAALRVTLGGGLAMAITAAIGGALGAAPG